MENFRTFVSRHRFELRDLFPSPENGITRQHYELAKYFQAYPNWQWSSLHGGIVELNRAFALAEYMSECKTDEPDSFARFVSNLSDDAWTFAIHFTPYNKVSTALENLEVVRAAMFESVLALNAAKAGMESATEFERGSSEVYARERSKATSSLLNFSALYASYIDICRRIRGYCGLENENSYTRAIDRILGRNSGAHDFIKGFRNFILHHHLPQPAFQIEFGEVSSAKLYFDSSSLLYSGSKWKAGARLFLQVNQEIDIQSILGSVFRDVERLIKFHVKITGSRMRREKTAFEIYRYERMRFNHLQSSAVDMSAAFLRRSTPVISRLLQKEIIYQVVISLLSDDEVKIILTTLADRHKNLTPAAQRSVAREVENLLKQRTKFNNTGAYLQGREFGI